MFAGAQHSQLTHRLDTEWTQLAQSAANPLKYQRKKVYGYAQLEPFLLMTQAV
jgi:hypothetical protein